MRFSTAGGEGAFATQIGAAGLQLRQVWRLSIAWLVVGANLFITRATHSQDVQRAVVRGSVTSDSGRKPVQKAQIQLRELTRATVTDSQGRFEFREVAGGTWHVDVRSLGHVPHSEVVSVDRDTVELGINLTQAPVSLTGVIVTARGEELPIQLRDFARRRELGGGKFFTRQELEKSGAQTLETFIRARVGGFSFVRLPNGRTALAGKRMNELSLAPRRPRVDGLEDRCYVQIFINGQKTYQYTAPPFQPPSLDEFPITSLSAIELYRGAADTPTELSGPSAACGTVAIWNNVDNRSKP